MPRCSDTDILATRAVSFFRSTIFRACKPQPHLIEQVRTHDTRSGNPDGGRHREHTDAGSDVS